MTILLLFALWGGTGVQAQEDNQHAFDQVLKKVDDLLWHEKVGDLAYIDKVYLCGPAR